MRFVANRALLGAAAMIVVGIVLSMMSSHYITSGADEDGLIRSRWWWEIVLNSQILCAAFIWFTHIDRVKSASGWAAWAKGFQLLAGLVAVLLPVWLALVAIVLGWFEKAPSLYKMQMTIVVCLFAWFLAWALNHAMESLVHRKLLRPWFLRAQTPLGKLLRILPLLAGVLLIVVEIFRGGYLHYMYVPFLFYLQGAVPYLAKSIRSGKGDAAEGQVTVSAGDAE